MARLLPSFGGRVVFTRFLAPVRPGPPGCGGPTKRWPLALQPPDAELWRLTPEFAVLGAPVLDAETFGKRTPELAARLAPASRLVLAGVSTECCVLTTALAATDAGTEVVAVADACAGADDEAHARRCTCWTCTGPWSVSPRSTSCWARAVPDERAALRRRP